MASAFGPSRSDPYLDPQSSQAVVAGATFRQNQEDGLAALFRVADKTAQTIPLPVIDPAVKTAQTIPLPVIDPAVREALHERATSPVGGRHGARKAAT